MDAAQTDFDCIICHEALGLPREDLPPEFPFLLAGCCGQWVGHECLKSWITFTADNRADQNCPHCRQPYQHWMSAERLLKKLDECDRFMGRIEGSRACAEHPVLTLVGRSIINMYGTIMFGLRTILNPVSPDTRVPLPLMEQNDSMPRFLIFVDRFLLVMATSLCLFAGCCTMCFYYSRLVAGQDLYSAYVRSVYSSVLEWAKIICLPIWIVRFLIRFENRL